MKVIGLMSGTSGDGIDAALCEINGAPPQLTARIVAATTTPYPAELRGRILDACAPETGTVDALCQLNVDLGEQFAAVILELLQTAGIAPQDVHLIGSHGQTVWHNVAPGGRVTATLQITEGAVLAERTGITTINNFRARDVSVGGQGAPLTAYADWLLLRHPDHWRAIQNIGGMGNVTFLPPLADTTSTPLAFDTGPGNALIDMAVYHLTDGVQTYDHDGQMARSGKIDAAWLEELMAHPYFERQPPKTTGRELFGTAAALQWVREGVERRIQPADIVATLTALTALSIAEAYRQFGPRRLGEIIIGGGGARNPVLMEMLAGQFGDVPVLPHDAIGISADYKEALVFALLAYETWHARPGNLPVLTGAEKPVILGQIVPGENYIDLLHMTWGKHDVG